MDNKLLELHALIYIGLVFSSPKNQVSYFTLALTGQKFWPTQTWHFCCRIGFPTCHKLWDKDFFLSKQPACNIRREEKPCCPLDNLSEVLGCPPQFQFVRMIWPLTLTLKVMLPVMKCIQYLCQISDWWIIVMNHCDILIFSGIIFLKSPVF